MLNTKIKTISVAASIALLYGCSGGGGGAVAPAGPVISTLSFPLQSADKTTVANGWAKTFTISGTCSGTGSITRAPATTAATFEGVAGFSAEERINFTYTNCTPATTALTATSYYDSNYVLLGFNSTGPNYGYGLFLTPPTMPTSVTVGETGVVGTETLYTNSTKATGNGRIDASYVIEADTSTTAIASLIAKTYNSTGTLIATEQDRYRIAATGVLTPVSADIQAVNGPHLVWSYN